MNTRRLTRIALFTAMAIILHIAEGMIPLPAAIMLPGVKIGFANIITIVAIALLGFKDALIIVILRVTLSSLLTGMFFNITFLMSFSGSLAAMLIMSFLYLLTQRQSKPPLGMVGISIVGAVVHNLAQLSVAALIIGTGGIFYYLPVMLVSSVLSGVLIGILARLLLPRLDKALNI